MGRVIDSLKQVVLARPPAPRGNGLPAAQRPRYPESQKPWSWGFSDPKWGGNYSLHKGLHDAYEVMEVVRICVDKLSDHVSSVPWRVSRFSDEEAKAWFEWELKTVPDAERHTFFRNWRLTRGFSRVEKKVHELEPLPHHPVERLIEQPNEWMDRKFVMEVMVKHLLLGGNSLLLKLRGLGPAGLGTGQITEMFPLVPVSITPEEGDNQWIELYRHKIDGLSEPIDYPYRDVVHCMFTDPTNLRWGIPVLQSAMRTVMTDKEAVDWNKVTFQNRAMPDLGITYERHLDEDKFDLIRSMLRQQFTGTENARTPLVVGDNARFQQLSLTAAEMDFIESRQMNARWIHMAFGMDPRITGLAEATGNQQEIDRHHWNANVIPLLDRYMGAFNRRIAEDYSENLYIWPDTARVPAFAEDTHRRAQTAKVLASMGYSPNDLNERFNLGMPADAPHLDVGVVAASAIRVDLLEAQAEAEKEKIANGGNPDTAPDGGDPAGTPDEDNPENPNPEDPNPQDPQGVTPFPDQEAATRLLQVRWTSDEAERFLEDELELRQAVVIDDGENEYVYELLTDDEDLLASLRTLVEKLDGVEFVEDDEEDEGKSLRFYHGARDERKWMNRKKYLSRHGQLDFSSMVPKLSKNGHGSIGG